MDPNQREPNVYKEREREREREDNNDLVVRVCVGE